MLSTMHSTKLIDIGKKDHARNPIIKLKVVRSYKNNFSSIQRSYKLSKMLFLDFLEQAISNTFLFCSKSEGRKHFLNLRLTIHQMINNDTGASTVTNEIFEPLLLALLQFITPKCNMTCYDAKYLVFLQFTFEKIHRIT